jgi:hypothetical protein
VQPVGEGLREVTGDTPRSGRSPSRPSPHDSAPKVSRNVYTGWAQRRRLVRGGPDTNHAPTIVG